LVSFTKFIELEVETSVGRKKEHLSVVVIAAEQGPGYDSWQEQDIFDFVTGSRLALGMGKATPLQAWTGP
jgi:hypothetical protein